MPFVIPGKLPPFPDPLRTSFFDWVREQKRRREEEEALAKESGAALSASGAASGAAGGAGFGAMVGGPPGAVIGGIVGVLGGAVAGKEISPRMKPGKGPGAQPGNIAQDNAAIWNGIIQAATTVGKAYKKGKDSKFVGEANDAIAAALATKPPWAQEAAIQSAVNAAPESERADVEGFLRMSLESRQGPPGPTSRGRGGAGRTNLAAGIPGAPPRTQPPIPRVTPGVAQRPGAPPSAGPGAVTPRNGQAAQQQTRRPDPPLTEFANKKIKRLDALVDKAKQTVHREPEEMARFVENLSKQKSAILRNKNSYQKPAPTVDDLRALGQHNIPKDLQGAYTSVEYDNGNAVVKVHKIGPQISREKAAKWEADGEGIGARWVDEATGATFTRNKDGELDVLVDAPSGGASQLKVSEFLSVERAAREIAQIADPSVAPTQETVNREREKLLNRLDPQRFPLPPLPPTAEAEPQRGLIGRVGLATAKTGMALGSIAAHGLSRIGGETQNPQVTAADRAEEFVRDFEVLSRVGADEQTNAQIKQEAEKLMAEIRTAFPEKAPLTVQEIYKKLRAIVGDTPAQPPAAPRPPTPAKPAPTRPGVVDLAP